MSATAFISSGILERHIVGLTTPEEVHELEEMISQYPEISKEMQAIRAALHSYILAHQVSLPDGLKEKILTAPKAAPAPVPKRGSSKPEHQQKASMPRDKPDKPAVNWSIFAAAAFGLGLIAAVIMAMNLSAKVDAGETALAESQAEIEKLKTEKTAQFEQYEEVKSALDFRLNRNLEPIRLTGNNKAPNAKAVVYLDAVKKTSYIDVRKLPTVPEGEQLQLWATAKGKTENLGGLKPNEPNALPTLKYIDSPSLYFVTLEKAGDVPERPSRWRILMLGRVTY